MEIADKRETKEERDRKGGKKPAEGDDAETVETAAAAAEGDARPARGKAKGESQKVEDGKYQYRARTIAVGNLSEITAKTVLERAKRAGKVVELDFPASDKKVDEEKLRRDGCQGQVAFVTYHRGERHGPSGVQNPGHQ